MKHKVLITALVLVMVISAFTGVGYAYTAVTVNSNNTSTSEYSVISQSRYTYSPSADMDYYSVTTSGAYTVKVGTGAESGTLKKAEDCFLSLSEKCITMVVITGGAYDGTYTIDMSSKGLKLVENGGSAGAAGVTQISSELTSAMMVSSNVKYTFGDTYNIKLKVSGTGGSTYTITMPSGCTIRDIGDATDDSHLQNMNFTSDAVTFTCSDTDAHLLVLAVCVTATGQYTISHPNDLAFSLDGVVQNDKGVTNAEIVSDDAVYTLGGPSEHTMKLKVIGNKDARYTVTMPENCTIRGLHNATDAMLQNVSVTSNTVSFTCPDAKAHLLALTVDVVTIGDYTVNCPVDPSSGEPIGLSFSLDGVKQGDTGPLDFTATGLEYEGVAFDNVAIGNNITVVYDELARKYTIIGKLRYQDNSGGDAMDKLGMPDSDHYGVSFLVSYKKVVSRYFLIDSGAPYSTELFNGYFGKKIGTELNDITVTSSNVKVKCPDNNAHVLSITVDVPSAGEYTITHPDGMTFSLDGVTQNDIGVSATMVSNNVKYTFSSLGKHVIKVKVNGTNGTEYTIIPTGLRVLGACDGTVNTLKIDDVGHTGDDKVTITSDNGFSKLYGGWRYILKITNNADSTVQYAISDGGEWIYYHYEGGMWLQQDYLMMNEGDVGYDTELFLAGMSAHIEFDYASGITEPTYTGELNGRKSNDLVKNGTITFRYDSTYE